MPVVGTTSATVPWELIAAAGCFPLALRRRRGSTPNADDLLEPDVFTARIRGIFEGVVSGEWSFLRAIVVPRTSEQEYKLFLYLREIARERPGSEMPPVYLYDLLHTRSREAYEYGLDESFLRERAYPGLKEAARFVLDFLVEDPGSGELLFGPSLSPENQYLDANGVRVPSRSR